MTALANASQPQLFWLVLTLTVISVGFAVRLWLRVYRAAVRDEIRRNESTAYYVWDSEADV